MSDNTPIPPAEYEVRLRDAHNSPLDRRGRLLRENAPAFLAERDPFNCGTTTGRISLLALPLYTPARRSDYDRILDSSAGILDEHKLLFHHLPENVVRIIVTGESQGRALHAEYRIEPLPYRPITVRLPLGGGRTARFGDFTDWEGQPFAAEFAPSPWPGEKLRLFVRFAEAMPVRPTDEHPNRDADFAAALCLATWPHHTCHMAGAMQRMAQAINVRRAWTRLPASSATAPTAPKKRSSQEPTPEKSLLVGN